MTEKKSPVNLKPKWIRSPRVDWFLRAIGIALVISSLLVRVDAEGRILSLAASSFALLFTLRDWHLKPRTRRHKGDRISNYDGTPSI
jgi:hypothetical protein